MIGGFAKGLILHLKSDLPTEMQSSESSKIEELINEAYNIAPNYEEIIKRILENPAEMHKIKDQCSLKVGIPIKPMLSKSIKGFGEILERFKAVPFTAEYKYDGMRGQIHFNRDATPQVQIYSRNLEKMTTQFPELAS